MKLLLSWILFYLGHTISIVMDFWPCQKFHPYYLYNYLLLKSIDLQGNSKHGPWKHVIEEKE